MLLGFSMGLDVLDCLCLAGEFSVLLFLYHDTCSLGEASLCAFYTRVFRPVASSVFRLAD
jgi:hypothetical protein